MVSHYRAHVPNHKAWIRIQTHSLTPNINVSNCRWPILFDLALHKGPNGSIYIIYYLVLLVVNENLELRDSKTNRDTRLIECEMSKGNYEQRGISHPVSVRLVKTTQKELSFNSLSWEITENTQQNFFLKKIYALFLSLHNL